MPSFLGKIFGSAVGETVKGISEGVGGLAIDIRSAITGEMSPSTKAKLEELAEKGSQLASRGQVEINKIEAGSKSLFVAGWRPFIGWTCGLSLFWNYIFHPMLSWVLVLAQIDTAPPKMDMTELFPVVVGMLGLGAYRSYEKAKGVEGKR